MFQLDVASDPFKAALQRLNDCLQEENLHAIQRIQHKHKMEKEKLSKEDILVGIGNHVISKLSGNAMTSRTKRQHKCPCGCTMKLAFGEKMYIGKLSVIILLNYSIPVIIMYFQSLCKKQCGSRSDGFVRNQLI